MHSYQNILLIRSQTHKLTLVEETGRPDRLKLWHMFISGEEARGRTQDPRTNVDTLEIL